MTSPITPPMTNIVKYADTIKSATDGNNTTSAMNRITNIKANIATSNYLI